MRRIVAVTCAALVMLSFGVTAPSSGASERAAAAAGWCSEGPPPCLVSAEVNGSPVTPADMQWEIIFVSDSFGGGRSVFWHVEDRVATSVDLGPGALDDDWVFVIDPGTMAPRVASVTGTDVTIVRGASTVRVEATPITIANNDDCDPIWPWSCPDTPDEEWTAYLGGSITDYGIWDNAAQRRAFHGMNLVTNVALTSLPPDIVPDPATGGDRLRILMASHHFRGDGSTLFRGFYHLRIPNRFLRVVYGIDDPSTITGAGLETAGTGAAASVSVTQESSGSAVLVDITDMTFSRRRVRISRGVITPTKPKNVRARRGGQRVRLRFTEAKRRGSRITGYRALCVRGASKLIGRAKGSPVLVRNLRPGVRYTCRVRALSKAGPGRWSAKVRA